MLSCPATWLSYIIFMILTLENNASFSIQLLQPGDADALSYYFTTLLSEESKNRYAPHSFDRATVDNICVNLPGDTLRYVAIDNVNSIAAYMLVKKGMVEGDRTRLLMKGIYFDQDKVCTFAPSVADSWQN